MTGNFGSKLTRYASRQIGIIWVKKGIKPRRMANGIIVNIAGLLGLSYLHTVIITDKNND